jgi:hypothetical protein
MPYTQPSARVQRAQKMRKHRLGLAKAEDMDDTTLYVSATSTIICIFFLFSIGATLSTWYHLSECMGKETSFGSMGWAPDALHQHDATVDIDIIGGDAVSATTLRI